MTISSKPAHVCHGVHLQLGKPHIPVVARNLQNIPSLLMKFICEMNLLD